MISTPKIIGREWRLVIAIDEVVASSQYRDNGTIAILPSCPDEVHQFATDILANVRWRPDKLFMMDVCESDGKLCLLELNSFSCSGLYACDLAAVIHAASLAAESEWRQLLNRSDKT